MAAGDADEECKRIARELHDETTLAFAGLAANLQAVETRCFGGGTEINIEVPIK